MTNETARQKILRVGDRVRYELDSEGFPRWADDDDGGKGSTGEYIEATVVNVCHGKVWTDTWRSWSWEYPYEGDRPGYIELIEKQL